MKMLTKILSNYLLAGVGLIGFSNVCISYRNV